MNIAIFSDTFPPLVNGVANMAYRSAEALAECGHRVRVFTVAKEGDRGSYLPDGTFSVSYIPSIVSGAYEGYRLALPSAKWFSDLKKFKPDIIHSHTPFGVGWAAVIGAKMLRVPLVATHHTFFDHYLKHVRLDYEWMKAFSWKYTAAYYNRCDLVITPSRSLADAMVAKKLRRPIEIVENFIDTDFFAPATDEQEKKIAKRKLGIRGFSLVYMGRLSCEKSIDDVVSSFAKALQTNHDMTLILVGDGPERERLSALAEELHIGGDVCFTGFLKGENLLQALRASDVFVTASRSENMPLSVLEGMAVGLPVVAVKENGLGEIIEDGVNGFFAATGDGRDMADKMIRFVSDAAMCKRFGEASRTLALRYARPRVMEKMEAIYRRLIMQHTSR